MTETLEKRKEQQTFNMTANQNITEISVERIKETIPDGSSIGNDIILFDRFADVPLPTENCRMRSLFLALCTSGKAKYTLDTKERTVEANDVIIINEGQVVGDYLLSRDCSGIAIIFSYDFFYDIISNVRELPQLFLFSRTHPVFHLEEEEAECIKEYFYLIRKKVDGNANHFRKEVVSTLIRSLIYDVSNAIYRIQQVGTTKNTHAEHIFTNFMKLLEQNFRTERRVGWYAEQLCITPKYLSESVKAVSKRRPNEWIENYVTMEIRVLLKNTPLTIKEIAQQLNFANQSFLGKYFKEHVGMSPKEYRRS